MYAHPFQSQCAHNFKLANSTHQIPYLSKMSTTFHFKEYERTLINIQQSADKSVESR